MSTVFRTWPFKATGGTTAITLPDRLAQEKNVKDFGAVGDNSTPDQVAFQAAFDAAIAAGAGVYVPPGTYVLNSAITWNTDSNFGFSVRGAGAGNSRLVSSANTGYLIDRSLGSPNNTFGPRVFENLSFENSTTSGGLGGGLRIGSTIGAAVRNCRFACAGTGMTTEDTAGTSSQGISVDTCHFVSSGNSLSSIGLVMGGSGAITNSNFEALGTGRVLYGSGITVDGCRCERCNDGIVLGVDSGLSTNQGLNGFCLTGEEMEGVVTFIDFVGTVTGFSIGPLRMTGHPSANGGLETHNADTLYGIRIRADNAIAGEIVAAIADQYFVTSGIHVENFTSPLRAFLTFANCNPTVGGGGGAAWRIPSASVWPKFIECFGIDSSAGPTTGTRYLYANLPSGGDLLEGDEYDISNGNTSTIGNTVTGAGANSVRVRYNGTDWICIGG